MSKTYFYNGEEIDENQLIHRIRKGEEELFSLITSSYLPIIYKYVSSLNYSDIDKDDFVQIGLLALYGAVDAYDFKSASFVTFACLCIRRAIISELRYVSSKNQFSKDILSTISDAELWNDNDPESAFIDKESISVLIDKIKLSLSDFEYKVLTAYLKFGNYSKVGEALAITPKEINNALQRARKKIRKSIGNIR